MSGPRLSIIPARACTDPALKPRDLQVLCVFGRHTDDLGWCRRSQVKMADEMGCARSTVFDAIERLIAAGYVERHVQEEDNGRDSPHFYRVILDVAGSPSAAKRGETMPDSAQPEAAPPAGISAPPAGSGPAPKNDPSRTLERDAREDEETRPAGVVPAEDLKKIDADGWALLKNWPGFDGMPKEPALAVWRTLSAEDRASARSRFPSWLELLRRQKKSHVPAPSTYLRERLWMAAPDPVTAAPAPVQAAPFGKLWNAHRLAMLLDEPGMIPPPRGFIAQIITEGGERAQLEILKRQATYGWPRVNRMDDGAASAQGVYLLPERVALLESGAQLFEKLSIGGECWQAWQAMFAERGMPPLPDAGRHEWTYLPAGGPAGLVAFAAMIKPKDGQDDGGSRHAAE